MTRYKDINKVNMLLAVGSDLFWRPWFWSWDWKLLSWLGLVVHFWSHAEVCQFWFQTRSSLAKLLNDSASVHQFSEGICSGLESSVSMWFWVLDLGLGFLFSSASLMVYLISFDVNCVIHNPYLTFDFGWKLAYQLLLFSMTFTPVLFFLRFFLFLS